jgi:cytochrome c oxidase subunit 3/cytochrome o ubiquinol oxidase subunit 3
LAAPTVALPQSEMPMSAHLRGRVGMWCLIAAESAIFVIFVVAYLYYAGKSLSGPTPREVLEVPWLTSICLFSSSLTIVLAEKAIDRGNIKR